LAEQFKELTTRLNNIEEHKDQLLSSSLRIFKESTLKNIEDTSLEDQLRQKLVKLEEEIVGLKEKCLEKEKLEQDYLEMKKKYEECKKNGEQLLSKMIETESEKSAMQSKMTQLLKEVKEGEVENSKLRTQKKELNRICKTLRQQNNTVAENFNKRIVYSLIYRN